MMQQPPVNPVPLVNSHFAPRSGERERERKRKKEEDQELADKNDAISVARLNIVLVVRSDGESLMAEARHVAGLPAVNTEIQARARASGS